MNYTARKNGNNKVLKGFKDYLFPIIIVLIVFILVLNYLFSGNETSNKNENTSSIEVTLGLPDSEAYIVYSGGNKTKLEGNVKMYKGEKLQVVNGSLNLKADQADFTLNKLGEFRYNEDGAYTLYSSDLWTNTHSGVNIELRYAKVQAEAGSVFSLSQNEVASTVYVVSGVVDVQNLAGKTATLQQGEKLVIMRNSANDEASDLSLSKEQIDDYIKTDDWFIKNNGNFYLTSNTSSSGSLTASGETLSGSFSSTSSLAGIQNYIVFSNIYDEAEIPTSTIDIEGTVLSDMVFKVDIDGKTATLDAATKTFSLKDYKLSQRTNDIVYRVYDEGNKLLGKGVVTVYAVNGTDASSNNQSTLAQVENYPISSSPLYQILTPKQNPYTTDEDVVRIEGTVPTGTVEKIIVNDFELKKFPKYGAYWSYFANSEFGNLKEGVNIYKIQYFGAEGKLVYENNFTIIKNPKPVPVAPVTSTQDDIQTPPVETMTGTSSEQ